MADILVYALHYEGAINKNSLGAVSEAASLASRSAARPTWSSSARASAMTSRVARQLRRDEGLPGGGARGPRAAGHRRDGEDHERQGHQYALFGGGLLGFEIGAGLAARLGAGVTMEVTQVNVADGKLTAERPILGDSSISTSTYKDKGIIIGRLNAFEAKETGGGAATVEDVQVELSPWSTRPR